MPQVSGIVVEKWTRRPVVGATVRIGNYVGLTDSMGRFSVVAPVGVYKMTITHRSFHPAVKALNVLMSADIGIMELNSKVVAL
ncbi:unnamed protein product [marine sediment metagenome]|uniref:Carboxypeptidase regulatory-like domain-containing protein n=1 Tax=marine sediment metagenome TaxID=412755 RepID=X0ZRF1_9ZZZZ